MAHLDIRPANIFIGTSATYRNLDAFDPQRLVFSAQGYQNQSGTDVSSISLYGSVQKGAATAPLGNPLCVDETLSRLPTSASEVRSAVELLIVQSKYTIKLGDFGHCCHISELADIQVC
jgi:hypothetical protein